MSTTTPEPYPIWYPEASDPIAPLHNAFATLADSVHDAFEESVTPLTNGLQTKNYSVETVAAMNALTSVTPGSRAYVTTTKSHYIYDGTAWIASYIPWTNYTPTAITGLVFNTARYTVSNNVVTVEIKATKSTVASSFSALLISFPSGLPSAAIVDNRLPIGSGLIRKAAGGPFYTLVPVHNSTTDSRVYYQLNNPVALSSVTQSAPMALVNTDIILLRFSYSL
jgi:hypothetical protein